MAQEAPRHLLRSRLALAAICVLSFGLVTTVNRAAGQVFGSLSLPDSCLASALVCLAIYLAIKPARPFGRPVPSTRWERVRRLSFGWLFVWLTLSALEALAAGHWVRYRLADTLPQIIGFVLLGPLQEELLFRGAIFELAERAALGARAPVIISTIFYSLHHFQLHGYAINHASLLQVGFTIPMGLVFGSLRAETGSLWPPFAVHMLTNLPGIFGRPPTTIRP